MKYIMLANQGERHEDCIPIGLYTVDGFGKCIIEKVNEEFYYAKKFNQDCGFGYKIYIMDLDDDWTGYDCSHYIYWSSEDNCSMICNNECINDENMFQIIFTLDDKHVTFNRLISILTKIING